MIDAITVIVFNPTNPAAEPGCPNRLSWVLLGLRIGEKSEGQKRSAQRVMEVFRPVVLGVDGADISH